ncbi:MAG: zinc ribbon domain-containing protein [Clostridiales bacterium]|nr:zinc ribbon domain-containing protein [Clostridiales bacterium]
MALLQYKCKNCGKRFDELVKSYTETVVCPACGGETERDYSGEMFSATGKQSKKCSGNCKTCGGCR